MSLPFEALVRALLLAVVWWAVSEGSAGAWTVGLPVVALAAAASLALAPDPLPRPRLLPLLAFLPFFVRRSIAGGVDVARRAFDPALPLAPALVRVPVEGMGPAERIAFALVVSLLPGTLSARLEGDRLRVHVLDEGLPVQAELLELEARLAPVFGRAAALPQAGRGQAG